MQALSFLENEKVCSISASHSTAKWHCLDCNRSICNECLKSHRAFTEGHHITFLGHLKTRDLEWILMKGNRCALHKDQGLLYYCKQCEKCVCITCLSSSKCSTTSGKHETSITLSEFLSSREESMRRTHNCIKVKIQSMKNDVKKLEDIAVNSKSLAEKQKSEVQKTVHQLIAAIRESEQELINQIEAKVEESKSKRSDAQRVLDWSESALQYMGKMIEKNVFSDVKTAEYIERFVNCQHISIPEATDFRFVPSKVVTELKSGASSIGKVEGVDSAKSCDNSFKAYVQTLRMEERVEGELRKCTRRKRGRGRGRVALDGMTVTGEIQRLPSPQPVYNSSTSVVNVKPNLMKIKKEFEGMKEKSVKDKYILCIAVDKETSRVALCVLYGSDPIVCVLNVNGNLLMKYMYGGLEPKRLNKWRPQSLAFLNKKEIVIMNDLFDKNTVEILIVDTSTGMLVRRFGRRNAVDKKRISRASRISVDEDEDSNIIVSDGCNSRVLVFTKYGVLRYQFGIAAKEGKFSPFFAIKHDGMFYVSDNCNHVIHVFNAKDEKNVKRVSIGSYGSADGQLNGPRHLTFDNDNYLIVVDNVNARLQRFNINGRYVGKTVEKLTDPDYIGCLKDGQLLVSTLYESV